MSVRLYGRAVGNGSHAVVTRGFREVLESEGMLDGFVELEFLHEDADTPGATAKHGVFTGQLKLVPFMTAGTGHEHRWVVVAPNSTYLPPEIIKMVRDADATAIAPSAWAEEILKGYGLPTIMVHHGIDARLESVGREEARQSHRLGEFNVLHFSTSMGQRKGTLELIQAWKIARGEKLIPEKSRLICVLDTEASASLQMRLVDADLFDAEALGVIIKPRLDVQPHQIGGLLRMIHLVCQPSRGEAFGLIGLEAAAQGVPTLISDCTGHSAYADWWASMTIESGGLAPIDDGPGALAPTIPVRTLADLLGRAHKLWLELDTEAQSLAPATRKEWLWSRQLADFVKMLKSN